MRLARLAGAGALGYLVGTFPTADIVARRASGGTVDLRSSGTGNPGGANALKVLGAKAGVAVIAGDVAKGALACAIGGTVAGPVGAHLAGTASVVGHCFPVWNGFRGGKGVAAGVGQCLATFPAYFPIDLAVAAATMSMPRWKQRAFTATLVSSAAWVLGAVVWWRRQWPNLWGPRPTGGLPVAAVVSSVVIAYRFATARPLESS
jgi:acyl phosphate:glycerol-3-phosphate acyltransferase